MYKTSQVWAAPTKWEKNTVRQLLVPAGDLDVEEADGERRLRGLFGSWPSAEATEDTPDGAGVLTAVIPAGAPSGEVTWIGERSQTGPDAVRHSLRGSIGYHPHGEPGSLRRPQLGALHAVMAHWASGLPDPGVVVMPTGTGKTETMLAVLAAADVERLLVLVPSTALRDQLAGKFETLGVLQREQIMAADALRPCVGRLEHSFTDPDEAARFAQACNVVVATPYVLNRCSPDVRTTLLGSFSHLIVDEAHHAPAATWTRVIDTFAGRPVLLFTATPFREDGLRLPGRIIFRFPLREAQRDGIFGRINYRAVLGQRDTDRELAEVAVGQLRSDRAAGFDHLMMVRAESIAKAEEIGEIYRALAPEFAPTVVHQNVGARRRAAAMQALKDRSCRIIVCVDMLGEGFDEPALKIAAMHAARRSLSPMLQFIGRFARAREGLGEATLFVAHEPDATSPLRQLLREDADWNLLLQDLTDSATSNAEEIGAFDATFTDAPEDVTVSVLEPKMSAVAYRAPSPQWTPEAALALFRGNAQVLDNTLATGGQDNPVVWFVVEHRSTVRWGAPQTLEQVIYELYVLYFDVTRRLLYIHGSEKSGTYKDLAEAVLGTGCELINGTHTYRVLAEVDRLIPSNVGLKDARNHFTRFSLHVGSDVSQGFDTSQEHKSQTHIAASGFENGDSVSISAAYSGRFWTPTTAPNLKAWTDWCDHQGSKLLDSTINLGRIVDGFIIPEDIDERPEYVLLAVQWPWQVYTGAGRRLSVHHEGRSYPLADVDFEVDDHSPTGPFRFSLVTDTWRIPYQCDYENKRLVYRPLATDAQVQSSSRGANAVSLHAWLNANRPELFLEGDRLIDDEGRLLNPSYARLPFDTSKFVPLDWQGVDFTKESQRPERRPDSIQFHMSTYLRASTAFDVLIDDDGPGEAADLVGLQVTDGRYLDVTLVHCKYTKATTGRRIDDLYEVCGQAVRSAKWRRGDVLPLLDHLRDRAQRYMERTNGISPYEIGGSRELIAIRDIARTLRPRFHTVIVQPGLQAGRATHDQLLVLAGAEQYVRHVTAGDFTVYCSP
ncbi:DEAD/DEAH box helicase [Kitasatospora purpeofusca]|uniref:DEAD/DEAH box helicase n=1 Tax=Kitasatospora purpeofusca TaxID=67352 RepID=UPI0035DA2AC7